MEAILNNSFYLDTILPYTKIKDITFLSMTNKRINKILDPKNNKFVNTLWLLKIKTDFFEMERAKKKYDKKNLLGKNLEFKINWKDYWKELNDNFNKFKDEKIRKRIGDFFQIRVYLPDLRKEVYLLEYQNSTLHQIKSYDVKINQTHTYNFYSKYFTPELILNPNDVKSKIIILRERLVYEDYLINFKTLFYDFINNDKYIFFINNVCEYQYDVLKGMYLKDFENIKSFNTNEQNSNIISFILWICYLFIVYAKISSEYMKGLLNDKDIEVKEFFKEYTSKKNDLVNCALLINSAFENVNIIVNLLQVYKKIFELFKEKYLKDKNTNDDIKKEFHIDKKDSDEYKRMIIKSEKFTLYNLFYKIIDQYYTKALYSAKEKFPIIVKDYFKDEFYPPKEEEIQEEIKIIETKKESNESSDKNEIKMDIEEEEEKKKRVKMENEIKRRNIELKIHKLKNSNKYILENLINCILDNYINGNNSFGIMHSGFKINENYIKNIENVLIECFKNQITKCINDQMPKDKICEIVEKITKCEGNSKHVFPSKDSLSVIRRTKMRLMNVGYLTIFKELLKEIKKDFLSHIKTNEKNEKYIYLSVVEKLNMKEFDINMDVLSREGQINVVCNVKNECKMIEEYLIKDSNLQNSEAYLASDYIKTTKINYIYFLKEFLYNYYLQLEIYYERNYRIEFYLNKGNNIFIDQNDRKNNIPENNSESGETAKEHLLFPNIQNF